VGLSVAVAIIASYTALKLAGRAAQSSLALSRVWLIGGACAMGIGIWSMHFIGMLAFTLPIELRYSLPVTLVSLAIAILTSAFAIRIASRPELTLRALAFSSVVMGTGIVAMHYTGMAAVTVMPGIEYDPIWVGVSVLIALSASFAALWLAFRLRRGRSLWL